MSDIEKAKMLLEQKGYTCVFCKKEETFFSFERGVAPLLRFIDEGKSLTDFCAADKVVGNAAAYLYVLLNVKELYAAVISKAAIDTLEKHNIKLSFDKQTDYIINRQKTGMCPMEEAVKDAKTPDEALQAIREKLKELSKKS